jgi:hypothetical protein
MQQLRRGNRNGAPAMTAGDARAASVLSRIAKRTEATRVVRWPGRDQDVLMRPVGNTGKQDALSRAFQRFQALKLDLENRLFWDDFQDECINQILFAACRDPEDVDVPFAATADELRDATMPNERAELFAIYQDFEAEVDPDPRRLGADEVAEIIDLVKKKDETRLRAFGSCRLVSFLLSTDELPPTSSPPKSGSTSSSSTTPPTE